MNSSELEAQLTNRLSYDQLKVPSYKPCNNMSTRLIITILKLAPFLLVIGIFADNDSPNDSDRKGNEELINQIPTNEIPVGHINISTPTASPLLLSDLDSKKISEKTLSPKEKEITWNFRKLSEKKRSGIKLGKIVVGQTTQREVLETYPMLRTSNQAEAIEFPLHGTVIMSFDEKTKVLERIEISNIPRGAWENNNIEQLLNLNKYRKTSRLNTNKYEREDTYYIKGLKSKAESNSIPTINISRDHGHVFLTINWPSYSIEELNSISEEENGWIQYRQSEKDRIHNEAKKYFQ